MPRYSLHLRHELGTIHRDEDFEAMGLQAAIWHALGVAGDVISEHLHKGMIGVSFEVCLDDEEGHRLRTMPVQLSISGLSGKR